VTINALFARKYDNCINLISRLISGNFARTINFVRLGLAICNSLERIAIQVDGLFATNSSYIVTNALLQLYHPASSPFHGDGVHLHVSAAFSAIPPRQYPRRVQDQDENLLPATIALLVTLERFPRVDALPQTNTEKRTTPEGNSLHDRHAHVDMIDVHSRQMHAMSHKYTKNPFVSHD